MCLSIILCKYAKFITWFFNSSISFKIPMHVCVTIFLLDALRKADQDQWLWQEQEGYKRISKARSASQYWLNTFCVFFIVLGTVGPQRVQDSVTSPWDIIMRLISKTLLSDREKNIHPRAWIASQKVRIWKSPNFMWHHVTCCCLPGWRVK